MVERNKDGNIFQMPGVISFNVCGVLPAEYSKDGTLIKEDNLAEKRDEIIDGIKDGRKVRALAWLKRKVEDGDLQATLVITAGVLSIFIGEFGPRHGKDAKYLRDILRRPKSTRPPKPQDNP